MFLSTSFAASSQMAMTAPHHKSVKDLWELKWKPACTKAVYPFMQGQLEDFQPIFDKLIALDLCEPYDQETWAAPFFPVAASLESRAKEAETAGDLILASRLNFRAAAVYRIARQPIIMSPLAQLAWERGKAAYLRASQYTEYPETEVCIGKTKAFLRRGGPAVLIYMTGLDAYRPDQFETTLGHVKQGFTVLTLEIPGTGDCSTDPTAADKLWDTVLEWIEQQPFLDANRIFVRGVSTGGYYALRIAHTHAHRLKAVVAHGGGCHAMFDPAWIDAQDKMDYPFGLAEALMQKFGYKDMNLWKKEAQSRFSLLSTGVLDRPSCRLLLINGTNETVFPIEDNIIPLLHGSVKDARFLEGQPHMGDPDAESYVYGWLDQFMGK